MRALTVALGASLQGGCVDSAHQSLLFLLMVLCPEDVSKVRVGRLAPNAYAPRLVSDRCSSTLVVGPCSIQSLRLFREFFGVTFKIEPDDKTGTVLLSCKGTGFKNLARKSA